MPTGPPRADHAPGHDVDVLGPAGWAGGPGAVPDRHQVAVRYGLFLVVLAGLTALRVQWRDVAAGYLRMLTALATTRIATSSEIASSAIIMSLAQGLIAETSVGLNAAAVVNDR